MKVKQASAHFSSHAYYKLSTHRCEAGEPANDDVRGRPTDLDTAGDDSGEVYEMILWFGWHTILRAKDVLRDLNR
jgi:hypothetical protein